MKHSVFGNVLEIWQPKYKENLCLIGTHKVKGFGKTYITFTKDVNLKGLIFEVDNTVIRSYPTQPNGRGDVYRVPMRELKRVQ